MTGSGRFVTLTARARARHLPAAIIVPDRFMPAVRLVIASLLVLLALAAPPAQADTAPVRVATRVIPPLVTKDAAGVLSGFSIDLWRAIAEDSGLPYRFQEAANLPELLAAVRDGQADLAIAAISITAERERVHDFSLPILEGGLAILVSAGNGTGPGFGGLLTLAASPVFLEMIGLLFALTIIPVPFIWWFERRHEEGIVSPESKRLGLLKAAWWSMGTIAGQADEMPRTAPGRVIALLWMLASVLFISYFTAAMTTTLTVREIETGVKGPSDLIGKRVGAITGSTGAAWLRGQGVPPHEFPGLPGAVAALEHGTIDAIVYDAPVLEYHASHEGRGTSRIAGAIFQKQDYGILLPPNSPIRKQINESLLKLRESGAYRSIHAKWFGQPE